MLQCRISFGKLHIEVLQLLGSQRLILCQEVLLLSAGVLQAQLFGKSLLSALFLSSLWNLWLLNLKAVVVSSFLYIAFQMVVLRRGSSSLLLFVIRII